MEYRMILWRMCVSNLGLPWMSNRKIDQILFLFREKKPSYLSSKYRIYQIARIFKLRILIFFIFMERYFRIKLKKLQRIVLKPSGLWIISEKDDRNSILWTVCVIQNTVVWTKMGVNRTAVNVSFHQKCPFDGVRVQGGANWNIASIWHQKTYIFIYFW